MKNFIRNTGFVFIFFSIIFAYTAATDGFSQKQKLYAQSETNTFTNLEDNDPLKAELENKLSTQVDSNNTTDGSNATEINDSSLNSGRVLNANNGFGFVDRAYLSDRDSLENTLRATGELIGSTAPPSVLGIGTQTNSRGEQIEFFLPIYSDSPGAISSVYGLTSLFYTTKPASVQVWGQSIRERANPDSVVAQSSLDSPTYQPGSGSRLLSPIEGLWRTSANIVYTFYIIIIIIIGFLIIFRSQLEGQNVITLFNAIPSLIISLLLVYFSYPLSALFIDLVTVGSGTVYGILIGDTEGESPNDPARQTFCANLDQEPAPGAFLHCEALLSRSIIDRVTGGGSSVEAETGLQIDDRFINVWRAYDTAGINPTGEGAGSLIPAEAPILSPLRGAVSAIADSGFGFDLILALILGFAALTASVKVFFKLLQEYIVLMVFPIIAPFVFLVAAIPGRTGGAIGFYFRRLLAASLSFIGVYALFLIVIIISRIPNEIGDVIWAPPLLGYSAEQLASTDVFNEQIVKPLIGYGLFVVSPTLVDFIKQNVAKTEEGPWWETIKQETQRGLGAVLTAGAVANQTVKGRLGVQDRTR